MNSLLAPLPTPCLACCDGVPQRRKRNRWVVRKALGWTTHMTTNRVCAQAVAHAVAQLKAMQRGTPAYVWIRKRFDDGWYDGYVTFQEPWFEAVYTDGDREDVLFATAVEMATAWVHHACLHQQVDDEQEHEQSIQHDAASDFLRAPPH